jgi:hypothetical protein
VKPLPAWLLFSLGSAFFAGMTAILGKLGVSGMNSNLATLINHGGHMLNTTKEHVKRIVRLLCA